MSGGSGLVALKRALGGPLRRAQRRIEQLVFERGLQPTRIPDRVSGFSYLIRGLWRVPIGPRDAFVDYGSGNGRVLTLAARYRFARVIGVEIDEAENAVARANAQVLAKRRRRSPIEVVSADATSWPLPDDVACIYLFNPFWDETFRAMLERVVESLERRPRPLRIIYANPRCAPDILATGRFERVRVSRGLRRDIPAHRVEVFRALIAGEST